MTRILIAEDDPLVASFVEKGLRASGFVTTVAPDGSTAIDHALAEPWDLVVLDMALPEREGFEVLREIRSRGLTVPVLVLTGRPDLRDAVECLDVGADDYMTKPFQFEELLARVRARLREVGSGAPLELEVGGVRLDLRTRRAYVDGQVVDLTGREFSLLETFMRHPDHALSREQLLSQVWGYSFDPASNVVNVFVSALRRKLGTDVIRAQRGVGYRFVGRTQARDGASLDDDPDLPRRVEGAHALDDAR